MAMFSTITDRIQANDVEVVEVLCRLGAVLQDLMGRFSSLHDALASSLPAEPEGLAVIADIRPADGNIDACEWSECLKAVYPFTLIPADREALAMNEGRPEHGLAAFLSWYEYDRALCTGSGAAPPAGPSPGAPAPGAPGSGGPGAPASTAPGVPSPSPPSGGPATLAPPAPGVPAAPTSPAPVMPSPSPPSGGAPGRRPPPGETPDRCRGVAPAGLECLHPRMAGIKRAAAGLCGSRCATLYGTRMAMFYTIADRIQVNDAKAVELLCGLGVLLEDLMGKYTTLHDAIAATTLGELEELHAVADISPTNGKIDPCEWSELLKSVYTFWLRASDCEALARDDNRSADELTAFLSWDEYDTGLCTGGNGR